MISTQPHYIKPNDSSRMPRRWIYLDTEAYRTTYDDCVEQEWRLAVTCFDNRDNNAKKWRAPEWRDWFDPYPMWEYISNLARPKSRTIIVAHNVSYDVRISRALEILPRMGWELDIMAIGARNLTFTFRRDQASLVFTDFMAWVPTSLDKIGQMLQLHKLDLPPDNCTNEELLRYCRRDVDILREANMEILKMLEEGDLGNWQKTGAGMAWSVWRHLHYTHKVLVHSDDGARELETVAAATGRCEAWRHGPVAGGPWYEFDLPMAYPYVARDTSLPTMLLGHDWHPTLERLDKLGENHRVLVTATVETEEPILPIHTETGWLWPVGKFSGTWWDHELNLARDRGATVTPTHAIYYKAAPLLAQWAEWIINLVEDDESDYTPLQRAVAKHWSRALIGRFGARYPLWEDWGESLSEDVELRGCYDADTHELGHMLTIGNKTYMGLAKEWVADACPSIMGAVMAECRIRLWEMLEVAGRDNVAYMDTDSLIVNAKGKAALESWISEGNGWGLRRKGTYRRLDIMGPRQLIVNGKSRIAGIPTKSTPISDNEFIGERWDGVESSLGSGAPSIVVARRTRWIVEGVDHRRAHEARGRTSGWTSPRHYGDKTVQRA